MLIENDNVVEQCWILTGRQRGGICLLRRRQYSTGSRTRVGFDADWVMAREESHGDVIGFLHTHPDGPCRPSERDRKTMRAWSRAFGKPMVCAIDAQPRLGAWIFDEATFRKADRVVKFDRGVVVVVE